MHDYQKTCLKLEYEEEVEWFEFHYTIDNRRLGNTEFTDGYFFIWGFGNDGSLYLGI